MANDKMNVSSAGRVVCGRFRGAGMEKSKNICGVMRDVREFAFQRMKAFGLFKGAAFFLLAASSFFAVAYGGCVLIGHGTGYVMSLFQPGQRAGEDKGVTYADDDGVRMPPYIAPAYQEEIIAAVNVSVEGGGKNKILDYKAYKRQLSGRDVVPLEKKIPVIGAASVKKNAPGQQGGGVDANRLITGEGAETGKSSSYGLFPGEDTGLEVLINARRAEAGATPLSVSKTLKEEAEKAVIKMAEKCTMQNGSTIYGETMLFSISKRKIAVNNERVVKAWMPEKAYCKSIGESKVEPVCLAREQVEFPTSKEVGCASGFCDNGMVSISLCLYYPQANALVGLKK